MTQPTEKKGLQEYVDELFLIASKAINDGQPTAWHRLPPWLGVLNLIGLRVELRQHSLFPPPETTPTARSEWAEIQPHLKARSADGSYNDLEKHDMGRAGSPFSHNVNPDRLRAETDSTHPGLLTPNPAVVSQKLLARGEGQFTPHRGLNVLAAAWIQFQVHGWFNHKRSSESSISVPVDDTQTWPDGTMKVPRTETDDPAPAGGPPVFRNTETHWWDGSQIYGSSSERQSEVRSLADGKLKVEGGRLPEDPERPGIDQTGFNDNYWAGLSLMHTLFALEHNAICDKLQASHPDWDDDRLFHTARLINCAVMAKIHTVEWTPGALAHPTLDIAMKGNWWGLLTEDVRRNFGRLLESEAMSGIPGSTKDHHGVDFAMTEEFVSVYRMHPLIPDEFAIEPDAPPKTFDEIQGANTRGVIDNVGLAELFESFGRLHPGRIELKNFPRSLTRFQLGGSTIDLGAVDILRDRERGVPRYNAFRRLLRLKPAESFDELTGGTALRQQATAAFASALIDEPTRDALIAEATSRENLAREIDNVYVGEIEHVDLMVGLFAERPPAGFSFSDTTFRIFIVMAGRRLKSDRFFTTDYNAEIYTQSGMDWIDEATMTSVLERHFPELRGKIHPENAFAPWPGG